MKKQEPLYILSNGKVGAINKKTGEIIWEVKLKEYTGTISSFAVGRIYAENDKLYIGFSGLLLCLNAKDGSLVWKNELKGRGYGFVSMANINNEDAAAQSAAVASSAAVS